MSWYQCSTCGDLFGSAGDLAAHKRQAHLATARQSARHRVVAAALALTAGIALAACDDPAPAFAAAPISTTTPPQAVVVDVTPPVRMPESVSVPASPPVTIDDLPPSSVAVGEAPVLPVTGGADLALACIGLGFVLVGATLAGPLARRRQ